MNRWSQQKKKIVTLTKQGVNCWLAYVLAQPVDIDLAVVAFLIIDYFGIIQYFGVSSFKTEINESSRMTENNETSFFFSVSVSEDEKEKSFEKVIA
jgi:hypothetical protein